MLPPPRAHVLAIQDNEVDGELLRQVWGVDPEIKLTSVVGGSLAIRHLTTRSERIPNLILLAGRFPITQLGALATLAAFKADRQLRYIPIIVISGADSPEIIDAFYAQHAACVIEFPATLEKLVQTLAVMKSFWLSIARLPCETNVFYE